MHVLALNAGSNTLRHKLLAMEGGRETVLADELADHVKGPKVVQAAEHAVESCRQQGIDAIAYRVVHGGTRFTEPARVSERMTRELEDLKGLAPLHMPTDIDVIRAASRAAPDLPGIAVFDTAFHRTLPEVAWRYAIPDDLGPDVRRFGFHGIAHRFVVGELFRLARRGPADTRVISLHLSGGASACAIKDGASVDTSMGLTPLEGLVMGTRCGDIDPGLILTLLRSGRSVEDVEDLLYRKSGLLGLSGKSDDTRELEPAAAQGDARAAKALEIASYRVRKYIGAYAAAMGGLDTVVLGGALAEHSAGIRERALRGLEFLGIEIDQKKNQEARHDSPALLSSGESKVAVWMIPADEERQMAREAARLLQGTCQANFGLGWRRISEVLQQGENLAS